MNKKLDFTTNTIVSTNYNKSKVNIGPAMFDILISMYKNPINSIVREIGSNAIDATIEAGQTKPVIVILTNNEFSVEDFGVGINPNNLENYFDFGNSSKLKDNKQIGMFGLGAKCVLAYANQATVRTRFNGTEYIYLQFIDGEGIPGYKLLLEKETNENNGTKVSVKIKRDDIFKFHEEMQNLKYNKYIQLFSNYEKIDNNQKIYDYKTFQIGEWEKVSNSWKRNVELFILMKSIKYNIDKDQLLLSDATIDNTKIEWILNSELPIGIKIDDLNPTPSRDNIKYTKKNISQIREVLLKVYDEIIELIKEQQVIKIKTLQELITYFNNENNTIILGEKTYNYYSTGSSNNNNVSILLDNIKEDISPILYEKVINLKQNWGDFSNSLFNQLSNIYVSAKLTSINYNGRTSNFGMSMNYYKEAYTFVEFDKSKKTLLSSSNLKNSFQNSRYFVFYNKKTNTQIQEKEDLYKEILYKKYNKILVDKLFVKIRILFDNFYNTQSVKYSDYWITPTKNKTKRVIGNIYLVNSIGGTSQLRLNDYKWEKDKLYILGNKKDIKTKLYKLKFLNNHYIKDNNEIIAMLPQSFIKHIPDDVNYIMIDDYLKKEPKDIFKMLFNIISLSDSFIKTYSFSNILSTIDFNELYSTLKIKDNKKITKDILETLVNKLLYHDYNTTKYLQSLYPDLKINKKITEILNKISTIIQNYTELDTKFLLSLYFKSLK